MVPAELLRRVRRIQIRSTALATDLLAGDYHSAFKGRGVEFDEVREYQPGDDVRLIDWNVTARSGRAYVKQYREERELTVALVIDSSRSLDFGTYRQTKRELVTELAASLAFSAIQNNDKVGLVQFTDRIERYLPPRKGRRHVLRLLRDLLYAEPAGRGSDLAGAVRFAQQVLPRRAIIFLVSDFQRLDFETALRVLRRRHDVVPVLVEDRRERALTPGGWGRFEDAETGRLREVPLGGRRFRRRYAQAQDARRAALRQTLRRMKLDLVTVETGQSFVEPLHRFFQRRQRRVARA
jgi:uncharacterized protein (DUF58 family)